MSRTIKCIRVCAERCPLTPEARSQAQRRQLRERCTHSRECHYSKHWLVTPRCQGKSLRQRHSVTRVTMHDRSLSLALAQRRARGRWRRDASMPGRLPFQHKTRCHSELLPLSAGERRVARKAASVPRAACGKTKTRGSVREQPRPIREQGLATLEVN